MQTNSLIVVGKIGAPYGLKGSLKFHSFTEPSSNLLNYQPLYILKEQVFTPLNIMSLDHYKASVYIANLQGCYSPLAASIFTNHEIYIYRNQMLSLPLNQYYWDDLIGLNVFDEQQKFLGKISWIMETGSNDVLVIEEKPNVLIPFLIPDTITHIDLVKGCLFVTRDRIVFNK